MPNLNQHFQIVLLQVADIPELINCVRRCYGESYPFKQIYNPKLLEKLLLDKAMHSLICKNEKNKVLGHSSLTFAGPDNTSPELGKLFVDPEYRGHHIADLLVKKLVGVAQDLDIGGFWSECVTNHPYSQEVLISSGGVEVGIFLGDIQSTVKMQGENNFTDSRMSLITYYLPTNKSKSSIIFVPESQAICINRLASQTSQIRHVSTDLALGAGLSKFTSNFDPNTLDANILISHIGADFESAMQTEIGRLEKTRLASIYIDLPICNPAAATAYLDLEKLGFFFGSWLPNFWNHQDILRLQKIYTHINESEIICARNQGENIKAYALAEKKRISST